MGSFRKKHQAGQPVSQDVEVTLVTGDEPLEFVGQSPDKKALWTIVSHSRPRKANAGPSDSLYSLSQLRRLGGRTRVTRRDVSLMAPQELAAGNSQLPLRPRPLPHPLPRLRP